MRTRLRKLPVVLACAALVMLTLLALVLLRLSSSNGDYMLVDGARLASLPASGAAYANMKKTADDAIASTSLSKVTSSSPWLPNYGGKGAETLAAALVYARTGDTRYRDFVIKVNRFVIGSEDSSSTNGTSDHDKLLATMRQISGYVLAADLVGMDPDVTGSRSGYTSTVWKTWLGALRTKSIGTSSKDRIDETNETVATNWGAWASAARTTIGVYLNDRADLALAVERLKMYLGETASGTAWTKSSNFDPSFACVPARLAVSFVPINPADCGPDKDGIVVEDASRSEGAFPRWDSTGIDYSFHAYDAQLIAAIVLDRQGYDVWNWGNRALKRVMDQLHRLGVATGNGRDRSAHVSWIPRYFYGVDYPTTAASRGNSLSYTDWLYGAARIKAGQ